MFDDKRQSNDPASFSKVQTSFQAHRTSSCHNILTPLNVVRASTALMVERQSQGASVDSFEGRA
jgi:hypothetical protein